MEVYGIEGVYNRIRAIIDRIEAIKKLGQISTYQPKYMTQNTNETKTGKTFEEVLKEALGIEDKDKGKYVDTKVEPTKEEINELKDSKVGEADNSKGKGGEGTLEKIEKAIKKASKQYNIPEALIRAVIKQESNFEPFAVSEKGAMGLMQLLPSTAELVGVNNIFDVEENILGGTKYLRMLLDRYNGDLILALAAYNAGPQNVEKYGNKIPPFQETRNFVLNVLKYYQQLLE